MQSLQKVWEQEDKLTGSSRRFEQRGHSSASRILPSVSFMLNVAFSDNSSVVEGDDGAASDSCSGGGDDDEATADIVAPALVTIEPRRMLVAVERRQGEDSIFKATPDKR